MSSPVDPNNGISNFSNPNKRKEKPTPLTLSPEAVFRMISATPPPQQATPLIASRVAISPKSSPPEFARPITPLPSILRQTIAPQTPRGPMPLSPPRNRFQGFDESPETDSTVPSMQRDYVSIQFSNPQPSDPLPMPTRSLLLSNPNEGLNASDNLFPSETSRLAASRHPRAPSPDASSSSVPAQTEMNADQKPQSAMANLPELVYRGTNHLAVKKALLFYMVFRQDFSCLLAQPAKAWNFVQEFRAAYNHNTCNVQAAITYLKDNRFAEQIRSYLIIMKTNQLAETQQIQNAWDQLSDLWGIARTDFTKSP